MLKELLFEKVPNLRKLEIQFCRKDYSVRNDVPSSLQLFTDSTILELPVLKVLCVNRRFRQYRVVVENILAAACHLEKFEVNMSDDDGYGSERSFTKEDLEMLQSFNK